MFTTPRITLVSFALLLGGILYAARDSQTNIPEATAAEPLSIAAYVISGPFTHDNLTVFLLHGPDSVADRKVNTLDEALAAGSAIGR